MSGHELQRRAIRRALARRAAATIVRVRYGLYRVASHSREGRFHTVSVDTRGRYRCDCEAGLVGRPCWAQAAVYLAKVEHAMRGKGRVAGPAAPIRRVEAPANVIDLRTRLAA